MNKNELKQKRAKLIADARALMEQRGKDFGSEDQATFDKMIEDAEEIRANIERIENLESRESELEKVAETREKPEGDKPNGEYRDMRGRAISKEQHENSVRAYEEFLRSGTQSEELRALEAGDDVAGGFTLPSQQIASGLLKNVDDQVFIRQRADGETLTQAESLGIVTLNDPDDFDWTTELLTGTEDSSMSFGKREMRPHPLAKQIKVSRTLLRRSTKSPINLINDRFGYKLGITLEKAYLTGNGNQQPLGVFVASDDGVPTSRDVTEDMGSTEMTADGLISCKYSMKSAYWSEARWLFHRDGMKNIAKLKDGDGQYLFNVDRNQLLGFPVDVNENAPNTFTSGQYVGILAAWRAGYKYVDALTMTTQRLDELYAATNQVGFIMRYEGDGAPVLAEAFVRVKLA